MRTPNIVSATKSRALTLKYNSPSSKIYQKNTEKYENVKRHFPIFFEEKSKTSKMFRIMLSDLKKNILQLSKNKSHNANTESSYFICLS